MTVAQRASARERGTEPTATAAQAPESNGATPTPRAAPRARGTAAKRTAPRARDNGDTGRARTRIPTEVTLPDGRKYWQLINSEWLAVDGEPITVRAESGVKFAHGTLITHPNNGSIIETEDGKPIRVTAFMMPDGKPAKVLIEGTIIEASTRMAYEIEPDRSLSANTARRSITATWEDSYRNVKSGTASVSKMRQAQNSEWTEPMGFLVFYSLPMLSKYLRALAGRQPDKGAAIVGQGAVYSLNGSLILATQSGCYDEYGNPLPEYVTDLGVITNGTLRRLHDITPLESIKRPTVHAGFAWAEDFLALMPNHQGVTATLLGQLAMSVLAPLHIKYWVPVWLGAATGKGKTYLAKILLMIQSREIRDIRQITPELNLGDTAGTSKGPNYRVPVFGLGTILADDVFTSKESTADRVRRTQIVDSLVRGREEGAAAIGAVDRVQNRVTSRAAGQLHTSVIFTAEDVPPRVKGEVTSTANRLIIHEWSAESWREVFSEETSKRLTDTANDGHAAYSAVSLWVWAHRAQVETLYEEAQRITAQWNMRGLERVQYRYTAVVCGLLCWQEVMREYGYTPKRRNLITEAINGARLGAESQARDLVDTSDILSEFLTTMRVAFVEGYLAASGRPTRPGAALTGANILPYRVTQVPDSEDMSIGFPPNVSRLEQLGLTGDILDPRPKRALDAARVYVKPPSAEGRGRKTTAYGSEWLFVMPVNAEFHNVCRALTRTRTDGLEFKTDEMRAVIMDKVHARYGFGSPGKNGQLRLFAAPSLDHAGTEDGTPLKTLIIIPCRLVFESAD